MNRWANRIGTERGTAQDMAPSKSSERANPKYGGFWVRFVACLLDGVFLLLVWHFLLSPVFMKIGMNIFSKTALPAATFPSRESAMEPAGMEEALTRMQEAMNASPGGMIAWIWIVQTAGLILFGGYFVVLEGGSGRTLGKRAMGLQVVNPEGESIGYLKAFVRYVGKVIGGLTLCLGFVMAGLDGEKRALHDRMAGSRVVRL